MNRGDVTRLRSGERALVLWVFERNGTAWVKLPNGSGELVRVCECEAFGEAA